jgi:hypothetical protein
LGNMKTKKWLVVLAGIAIGAYAATIAWRAHMNLVTLHVHNVPFTKVMAKIGWQTWEHFEWPKQLKGNLTMDVDKMPLDEALQIVAEQVGARVSTVYPFYRGKSALNSLVQAIQGDIPFAKSSFTNWSSQAFAGGRGRGFGEFSSGTNQSVSLVFSNKNLEIASLALSRVGHAKVIPQNGVMPKLNLTITAKPLEKAVAQVAKEGRVSWTKLYAFQIGGGGPLMARGAAPERSERSPALQEKNEERMAEVMETLPIEEQEKAKANQEKAQVMRELPAEARQQVMAERMNSAEGQQRMEQRSMAGIKNSTPEQRRERFERIYQMRQARAAGLTVPGRNPRG